MKTQTINFYNNFSLLYPLVDLFLKPQKKRLFDEVNNLPEGKLLEIGVGNGAHLQQYKKHSVVAIDTSGAMLNLAKKNNLINAEILEMSGESLEFNDQVFDYIVLSHVLAVVDNGEQVLEEVHRVLKPNGKVFILNHFTPDNWLNLIDRGFEPIARLFRFKSVFYMRNFAVIKLFTLHKEIKLAPGSYFKLLIYRKND